jgi:hypothetical protein
MPSFNTGNTTPEDNETPNGMLNADLQVPLLDGQAAAEEEHLADDNAEEHGAILATTNGEEIRLQQLNAALAFMMTDKWFQELFSLAEEDLPKPYNYKSVRENLSTALAIGCALCASILYILGGSKDGVQYVIGGVAVNLMQTFFFTKETISFFSKVHDQKQLAAISMFFALFSTSVMAFATFQMSDSDAAIASLESAMVFAGNLPQNLYGMFESIKRILDSHRDNPAARDYLLEKLRIAVDREDSLKYSVPEARGVINKTANQVVGFGIGVFLSLAQVGYIRSSVKFVTNHSGSEVAGLMLGLLTNLPTLCISMFISGKTLAASILNTGYDFSKWIYRKATGQPVYIMTPREKFFLGSQIAVSSVFGAASHYSASTSTHLYNDNPPIPFIPTTSWLDAINRVAVNQGCQIFNGLWAIIPIHTNADCINKAYVKVPSEDEIRACIQTMVSLVHNKDITTITQIAFKAGYKPVAAAPSRFSIFGATDVAVVTPANAHNGYAQLSQGEEPELDHAANLGLHL